MLSLVHCYLLFIVIITSNMYVIEIKEVLKTILSDSQNNEDYKTLNKKQKNLTLGTKRGPNSTRLRAFII